MVTGICSYTLEAGKATRARCMKDAHVEGSNSSTYEVQSIGASLGPLSSSSLSEWSLEYGQLFVSSSSGVA